MNDKKKLIFVDSDAFVALAKEDDSNHVKATKILEQLFAQPVIFVTSNYVFSETVTVISMKIGHQQAVEFIEKIKSSDSEFEIKRVDSDIETEAVEMFKRQTSKNISFTDCTNMAFLKRLQMHAIFSFDNAYKNNGFQVVESLLK